MNDANDFVRLNLTVQTVNMTLDSMGLEWVPPPFIHIEDGGGFVGMTEDEANSLSLYEKGHVLVRTSYSAITDEQIKEMPNVARGAEYHYMVAK